jgi:DnaJ-class molecular chaperone
MSKDYYRILGVDESASPDDIRRAYRKRAFDLHPDRNGGSRQAEDSFKELTEAYAVLGEPGRRASYDATRHLGASDSDQGFEGADLFSELFANPAFAGLFSQLAQEFGKQGLRFDEAYLRRVFSGQQGGVFFSGFVFAGPLSSLFGALSRAAQRPAETWGPERVEAKRPGFFGRLLRAALPGRSAGSGDVHYTIGVRDELLRQGGKVRVAVPGPSGEEAYDVRIPAGSRPGTRLRLAGRGGGNPDRRGDLYLELRAGG